MAYVGADHLAELVWSPHNGLSIRSSVGIIPEKKTSMYWEAELSEMVHSPTYSIATENYVDRVAQEGEFIRLHTVSPVEKDLAIEPALFTSLKGDAMNMQTCKLDIGRDSGFSEKMVVMNTSLAKDRAHDNIVGPNSMCDGGNGNTIRVVEARGSSSPGFKGGRTSHVIPLSDELHLNTRPIEFMPGGLNITKIHGSLDINEDNGKTCPLSPIEGNLLHGVQDLRKFKVTTCKEPVGSNTVLMEDGPNKIIDTVSGRVHPLEKLETETGYMLQSLSDSDIGIRNRLRRGKEQFSPVRSFTSKRKGKEIVVSSGDMKEEGGEDSCSYESVDCNTSRLVGARKRLAEQFIGGPKRVKLQFQETPDITSFTRSDGSFVNWISTLAKGSSWPVENGVPSLGDSGNETEKKGLIMCSRVQDHKRGKMGFQSLFGTLHQPKQKMQDQTFLSSVDPHANEGYKELEVVEKSIENNGSNNTKPCSQDDLVAAEQKMVSNESQNQRTILEEQDPLMHSSFLKRSVASVPSDCKTSALPKSYMSVQDSAESVKEHNQLSHFWLTHFCPKSSGLILNSANRIQGAAGVGESFADLTRLGTESQGNSCNELKKSHILLGAEASCAVKIIEGKKVNPILHSHRFKSSEAMASIFAKRVDALKQIVQTNLVDKATPSTITCFFCGIVGHDLRDCPQVTDTEVDKLLNEMTTYSGAEESCCFCIKCFQLNHWAVACPNAPLVNKSEVEHGAAVLHHLGLGQKLHLELLDGIDGQPLDVNLEIGETTAKLRRISPNLENVGAYCAEKNASKASATSHPCSSIGKEVVDKPRGIFEVVRSLWLSRTDVLKFMYSMVSISYLDGYYLRLRLGKPEEGIGGSGYQVACISALHGEESIETSKKSISVIVGGHRCSIESQCISNQDFLEDELMDWWSVMIRGGGKIPSEDELMLKVKERRRLGL